MNKSSILVENYSNLTPEVQKMIKGGEDEVLSSCSIICPETHEVKSRDCGRGVSCTTSETTIYCGSDGQEMCGPA